MRCREGIEIMRNIVYEWHRNADSETDENACLRSQKKNSVRSQPARSACCSVRLNNTRANYPAYYCITVPLPLLTTASGRACHPRCSRGRHDPSLGIASPLGPLMRRPIRQLRPGCSPTPMRLPAVSRLFRREKGKGTPPLTAGSSQFHHQTGVRPFPGSRLK